MSAPFLPCPHCRSLYCGPVRCRFSMLPRHELRANDYAEAKIRRDQEQRHTGRPEHDRDSFGGTLKGWP